MTSRNISLVLAALLIGVLLRPGQIHAQRAVPPLAQVAVGSPLPVYVVNDPTVLPEGFIPGTSWKFTTWTTPSTLTFTASVQRTEGAWALLALNGDASTARWYYIPHMPGAWQAQ